MSDTLTGNNAMKREFRPYFCKRYNDEGIRSNGYNQTTVDRNNSRWEEMGEEESKRADDADSSIGS